VKFMEQNEAKNVFKAARTPATLFTALMIFYLLSGLFGVFGLYPIASICNMCMGVFLVMLTLWAYVRCVHGRLLGHAHALGKREVRA
jgi:atlastin